MQESMYRCPTCQKLYSLEMFNCPECEEILNHTLVEQAPEPPREASVVRRLLAPDGSLERPEPSIKDVVEADGRPERTSPTVRMPYPEPRDGVPLVIGAVAMEQLKLTGFEAYVVSRIDGRTTVEQLRNVLGLSKLELQVVLGTLRDKGIIRVRGPAGRASTPPPVDRADTGPLPPPVAPPVPSGALTESNPPTPLPPRAGKTPSAKPPPLPKRQAATPPPSPTEPEPDEPIFAVTQGSPAKPDKNIRFGPGSPFLPPRDKAPVDHGDEGDQLSPLQVAVNREQAGDIEGAVRVLEETIDNAPDPAPLLNRLALVLLKERRDYPRAEELLNRAIALEPNNGTYRNNLAKVLMLMAADTGLILVPDEREEW